MAKNLFLIILGVMLGVFICTTTGAKDKRQASAWRTYNICLSMEIGVSLDQWVYCHNKGVDVDRGK